MSSLFPLVTPTNIGLNNLVAKETYAEIPRRKGSVDRTASPSSIAGTPSEKSPVEKTKYHIWPIIKRRAVATNLIDAGKGVHALKVSQSISSLRDYQWSPKSLDTTKLKGPSEESLLKRRKVSFPDLGIYPITAMTTVHEDIMDSPTIPGRFPLHERSKSAPHSSSRSQSENTPLAPVTDDSVVSQDEDDDILFIHGNRRDSSPDSIPTVVGVEIESKTSQSSVETATRIFPAETGSDTPPAVPPKSPRMTVRTPLSSQQPLFSKFSIPTPQLSPKIADKQINFSTNPELIRITNQWQRPDLRPRAATDLDIRAPSSLSVHNHQRSESASGGWRHVASQMQGNIQQKEEPLGLAMMDRGRPVRRGIRDAGKWDKQTPSGERRGNPTLPTGMTHDEAKSLLSPAETERLQYKARVQAQKFSVLSHSDVKSLSLELRVLDERSEYLRETHRTLRTERQELHQRMIHFLRSPGLRTLCREVLLRQEEALAELDKSIGDWVLKLEQVENRRTRVRQKLLEHIAAALLLQVSGEDQVAEQQTPPRSPASPEKDIEAEFSRKESIKIYADSKVFADAQISALFHDIEREMELMKQETGSVIPPAVFPNFV